MRTQWDTLWTFKTPHFTINWDVAPEDDLDLSWDDTGEVRDKLERGVYSAFQSRMIVYCDGAEVGTDYLGGSVYENVRDFRDHFGMNGKGHGSYFSDMVREAIREARASVAKFQSIKLREV